MINILKLKDGNDNFREKHYFISFLFWLILFVWIGFRTDGKMEYFLQIFFLFLIISIGTKVTPYGTYSILVRKFSQTEKKVLSPGIYVFNLFYVLFHEIKGPFLLKKEGTAFLANEKVNNDSHHLHVDTRDPIMTMPLTFGQGILIKFLNWLFRKDFPMIVIYLCVSAILGGGLVYAKQSIFNSKEKTEVVYQAPKQQTYASQENKELEKALKEDPELRKLKEEVDKAQSQKSSSYDNPTNENNNSIGSEWQPDHTFIPNMTWDNLVARDEYSVIVNLAKGISYVDIKGNFVWYYNSNNYYPHVYVDGYEGDQDFFCKFFMVTVNKITSTSGAVWTNSTIEFSDYVSFVKNQNNVSDQCYRYIRILLKPQFRNKVSWHIIDAGWGINDPFKIFFGDQYMTSLFDSKKFQIPLSKIN